MKVVKTVSGIDLGTLYSEGLRNYDEDVLPNFGSQLEYADKQPRHETSGAKLNLDQTTADVSLDMPLFYQGICSYHQTRHSHVKTASNWNVRLAYDCYSSLDGLKMEQIYDNSIHASTCREERCYMLPYLTRSRPRSLR